MARNCESAQSLVDTVLLNLTEMKSMQQDLSDCVRRQESSTDIGQAAAEHLARCVELQQELLREMLTTPLSRRLQLPRQQALDAATRRASVRAQLGLPALVEGYVCGAVSTWGVVVQRCWQC